MKYRARLTLPLCVACIAAWAVLFAHLRSFPVSFPRFHVALHSTYAWPVAFITAFCLADAFLPKLRTFIGRGIAEVLLCLGLATSAYLAWAHHLAYWRNGYDLSWGGGFLHPHAPILALYRWCAAQQSPLPPGFIRMHGALPETGDILAKAILASMTWNGVVLGTLDPSRAFRRPAYQPPTWEFEPGEEAGEVPCDRI